MLIADFMKRITHHNNTSKINFHKAAVETAVNEFLQQPRSHHSAKYSTKGALFLLEINESLERESPVSKLDL